MFLRVFGFVGYLNFMVFSFFMGKIRGWIRLFLSFYLVFKILWFRFFFWGFENLGGGESKGIIEDKIKKFLYLLC